MKVKISFTVDIDPHDWEMIHATDPKNIKRDVKEYCEGIVMKKLASVLGRREMKPDWSIQ